MNDAIFFGVSKLDQLSTDCLVRNRSHVRGPFFNTISAATKYQINSWSRLQLHILVTQGLVDTEMYRQAKYRHSETLANTHRSLHSYELDLLTGLRTLINSSINAFRFSPAASVRSSGILSRLKGSTSVPATFADTPVVGLASMVTWRTSDVSLS